MSRPKINALADWLVLACFLVPALVWAAAAAGAAGLRWRRFDWDPDARSLAVLGFLTAWCFCVGVLRLRIIGRVNRDGVAVEAVVTGAYKGLLATAESRPAILWVRYTYEGQEFSTRLDGTAWSGGPVAKGTRVRLLVDPAKPSRCFLVDEAVA